MKKDEIEFFIPKGTVVKINGIPIKLTKKSRAITYKNNLSLFSFYEPHPGVVVEDSEDDVEELERGEEYKSTECKCGGSYLYTAAERGKFKEGYKKP